MILTACLAVAAVILSALLVACYVVSDKVPSIKLKGARVVVTGGSDGLGLILATRLAQSGSHVIIIARNQAKLTKALGIVQKAAVNEVRHGKWKAGVIESGFDKRTQGGEGFYRSPNPKKFHHSLH